MDFREPISFRPIYFPRVWGGRALEEKLGRVLGEPGPIGESWDLVDRPEAQSVIDFGPLAGMTLHELWTSYRGEVFGPGYGSGGRFPLIFKILDASELLSLQVHPPVEIAASLGGKAKTEAWYFLDATEKAEVFVGFRPGMTREVFEGRLSGGDLLPLIHRIRVSRGDAMYVPSGRCHAIGAGCLIAEIQQNSDTTYRVYDWNRMGLDGKPRALHVEQSLRCIDFADAAPQLAERKGDSLVESPHFLFESWKLEAPRRVAERSAADYFMVVEGEVGCGERVFGRGATFLAPLSMGTFDLEVAGQGAEVLRISAGTGLAN